MYCSYCGNQIPDNSKFCSFCGKPVQPLANHVPESTEANADSGATIAKSETTHANNFPDADKFNVFRAVQDTVSGAAKAVGETANAAAGAVTSAATVTAGAVSGVAGTTANAVASAFDQGVKAASAGARQVHQAFGGEYDEEFDSNLRDETGKYLLPDPIVDKQEFDEITLLSQKYEKLIQPSFLAKAGEAVNNVAPPQIQELTQWVGETTHDTYDGFTKLELVSDALEVAANGFKQLEEYAARTTVGRDYVLQRVNHGKQHERIADLGEICMLRSYDVATIARGEWLQHLGMAFVEGGGTGAAGFAGLAPNLALSMFLYFRAVQSVAMFYGYDVKNNSDEMVIASDVFSQAMSPSSKGSAADDYVGKILIYAETATIGKAAKKTWAAVIQTGSAGVLLAQMRALSNAAARKALEKSSKKTLENRVFSNALARIGERLTLKNLARMIPVVGAGFGALFDTAQMSKVLDFADLFYHKRFILEKPQRIENLTGQGLPPEEPSEVTA